MFYSQLLLSKKGALGVVWIAAHCYKRLKKDQVQQTDISASVDRILNDEVPTVTHRILAYLLLGVVRIYSKKVEYLFQDCNDAMNKLCEFKIAKKERSSSGVPQKRYHSVILPNRFELDTFNLEILEDRDVGGRIVQSPEELMLTDGRRKKGRTPVLRYKEASFSEASTPPREVFSPHRMDQDLLVSPSGFKDNSQPSIEILHGNSFSLRDYLEPMVLEEADKVTTHDKTNLAGPSHAMEYDSVASPSRNGSESLPSLENLRGTQFPTEGLLDPKLREAEKEQINYRQSNDGQRVIIQELSHDVELDSVAGASHGRCDSMESLEILITSGFSFEHALDPKMSGNKAEKGKAYDKQSDKERGFEEEHLEELRTQLTFQQIEHVDKESPTGAEKIKSQEVITRESRKCVGEEERPMSINVDVTPNSDIPEAGLGHLVIATVRTPAPKERGKVLKKRKKTLLDSSLILPNNVYKNWIDNPSDLKRSRRTVPETVLHIWRAHKLRHIPQSFFDPLIPCCISIDFDSLERKKESGMASIKPLELSISQEDSLRPPPIAHEVLEQTPEIRSPSTDRFPEQTPIAPGTPVTHFKSLRLFEPGAVADSEILEPTSSIESIEKRPSPSERLDLDDMILNEETNETEGDSVEKNGYSARTRTTGSYLHKNFLAKRRRKEDEVLNLSQLVTRKTRKESARLFYEILVLKTRDCIDVQQESPYGDILLRETTKLKQTFAS